MVLDAGHASSDPAERMVRVLLNRGHEGEAGVFLRTGHSRNNRAALSWHTARSHSCPRSRRSRAWSWCTYG